MQAVVKNLEPRPTKTGKTTWRIMLDNKWYSAGFNRPRCEVGDSVEFDIKMNGQYENADNIRVVGSAPVGSSGSTSVVQGTGNRERSIIRQNSVTNAVNFYTAMSHTHDKQGDPVERNLINDAQEVLVIARIFEMYSAQDMDIEALNDKLTEALNMVQTD